MRTHVMVSMQLSAGEVLQATSPRQKPLSLPVFTMLVSVLPLHERPQHCYRSVWVGHTES